MLLKSKKNTSNVQQKVKKPRKAKKNAILPEAESLLDKLNRKVLVEKLNATNAALNEIGLQDSSEDLGLVLEETKAHSEKEKEQNTPEAVLESSNDSF